MLTFQQQQKVLRLILERQTNKHCADCGSHSPTWASLDFGVFVCSNCSGAHRALGPTITRIKSTKLDQWNKDWVENMRIGNLQINQFWEADGKIATVKKPRSGATLDEHNRYVYDKYMRKKFVNDKTATDPLTVYKMGNHAKSANDLSNIQRQKPKNICSSLGQMPSIIALPKQHSGQTAAKKQTFDLLDDGNYMQQNQHDKYKKVENQKKSIIPSIKKFDDDDQFTQYIDGNVNVNTNINNQTNHTNLQHNNNQKPIQNPSKLSFDQLFKQTQTNHTQHPQQQSHTLQSYSQQNQQQWNWYNPNNMHLPNHGQMNYGYNAYNHPQYVNQLAHNPYIGYAPHNSLHAAYNMNFFN